MSPDNSFNTLLIGHMPRLRAYAIYLTRNSAAADDLLQETACKALRGRHQFTIGTNFTAWAFRILRNEFFSSLRRSKHTVLPIDALPEGTFSKAAEQEDIIFSCEVVLMMEKLQPDQREVLQLVCGAGLSYTEAAAVIDCSIGTVKSRLWRARQQMEVLLQGNDRPSDIRASVPVNRVARMGDAAAV
jgi:RNA polymerase sigma-70 factor (ECF subfamily)